MDAKLFLVVYILFIVGLELAIRYGIKKDKEMDDKNDKTRLVR